MGKQYRKQQEALVRDQIARTGREDALAAENKAIQGGERAKAEPYVASLENVGPTGMSTYNAAQYGAEKDKIANTYRGLRETALRVAGQRGLAQGPAGTLRVLGNTNEAEANAGTDAYRAALDRTQAGRNLALNYRTQTQNMYNPLPAMSVANAGAGEAGQLNAERAQMGSTLGDVASGVSTIAGGVASALAPGTGFMALARRIRPTASIGTNASVGAGAAGGMGG